MANTFVVMKFFKLTMLVCAYSLILIINSFAYTINDPVNNVWAYPGNPNNYDRIGAPIYELYGMDIFYSGNNIIFDIYTNFPETGNTVGSWHTFPADLAIDVDKDGVYDYGVAFTDHNEVIAGNLYTNPSWYMSNDYDPTPVHDSWPTTGARFVYHANKIVTISDYVTEYDLGRENLKWISYDSGNNPNIPDWKIHLVLDKDYLDGFTGDFNVFYGGATCANDFIGGNVIPEPATLSLLGLGLLGLLGLKRRKK